MVNTSKGMVEVSSILNDNAELKRMDGMMWTRDMKLGYKVTIDFCGISFPRVVGRGYIVASREETLGHAMEREGDEMRPLLSEKDYAMKNNGNVIGMDYVIDGNCTITVHEIHECTIYVWNNEVMEPMKVDEGRWKELMEEANSCYDVACEEGEWILKAREKAIEWEKRKNECAEYQCDNVSGFMSWSMCNNSQGVKRTCVNHQCLEEKEMKEEEKKSYVEIELKEGVKMSEMDESEIMEVLETGGGIKEESVKIGWEADDEDWMGGTCKPASANKPLPPIALSSDFFSNISP